MCIAAARESLERARRRVREQEERIQRLPSAAEPPPLKRDPLIAPDRRRHQEQ